MSVKNITHYICDRCGKVMNDKSEVYNFSYSCDRKFPGLFGPIKSWVSGTDKDLCRDCYIIVYDTIHDVLKKEK